MNNKVCFGGVVLFWGFFFPFLFFSLDPENKEMLFAPQPVSWLRRLHLPLTVLAYVRAVGLGGGGEPMLCELLSGICMLGLAADVVLGAM